MKNSVNPLYDPAVYGLYVAYWLIRYSLTDHADLRRETYAQWVTIGGRPEGDKKHAGGTPVKIDEQGRIQAGPAALRGKRIDELKSAKQLKKASILEEAGNVIVKEENERRKRQLQEAEMLFDIEADRVGEISRLLNQFAAQIADNPRRKRDIIDDAWNAVADRLGLERPAKQESDQPSLFGVA